MARILHCKLCADDAASSSSSRKKVFPAQSLEAPSSGADGARLSASEPSSCAVVKVTAQRGETFIIPNNFVPNRTILYLTAMLISDKYFNTIYLPLPFLFLARGRRVLRLSLRPNP